MGHSHWITVHRPGQTNSWVEWGPWVMPATPQVYNRACRQREVALLHQTILLSLLSLLTNQNANIHILNEVEGNIVSILDN